MSRGRRKGTRRAGPGRLVGAALAALAAVAVLAAGCGQAVTAKRADTGRAVTARAVTATGAAPAPWVPAARSMAGADVWLRAGEAASAAVARSHPQVLFVGDSITQWWRRFGLATWNADFAPLGAVDDGVVGDTTSNVLYRLEDGSLDGISPRLAVVMAGTNDIPLGDTPAQIARGVEAVVGVLHDRLPSARLLLLGLLPRGRAGSADRRAAAAVNRLLAASPQVTTGQVSWLDLSSRLLRPDGHLIPGVLHPDLLHPTALGYRLLGTALAPVVRSLLGVL